MRTLPVSIVAFALIVAAPGLAQADRAAAKKLNTAGMKAYGKRNWDDARARFSEAIAADPSFVLPHYNLASVLALQGEGAAALAELAWLSESSDPEAAKKMAKAETDVDFDKISTWAEFRTAISAARWDLFDGMARLTERNATWVAEGDFCGNAWARLTVKGKKVTYKTYWACDANETQTSDSGTAAAAGDGVTITWKKRKGGSMPASSQVTFVPCDDHPELICINVDGLDVQLARGRLDVSFLTPLK